MWAVNKGLPEGQQIKEDVATLDVPKNKACTSLFVLLLNLGQTLAKDGQLMFVEWMNEYQLY